MRIKRFETKGLTPCILGLLRRILAIVNLSQSSPRFKIRRDLCRGQKLRLRLRQAVCIQIELSQSSSCVEIYGIDIDGTLEFGFCVGTFTLRQINARKIKMWSGETWLELYGSLQIGDRFRVSL